MDQTVLVTGGSGFVASHCLVQLLEQGFSVRTTIRDMNKKDRVKNSLKNAGIHEHHKLTFIEADLLKDENWDSAMIGCDYVLHVASPIFLRLPKNEDEMIKPAVEGTIRVLRAATLAGVKRVVMTSNFGAIGYSHKDHTRKINESDWTNPDEKGLSIYNKSKVLAERAAWQFIDENLGVLELSVVNPMGIFGPALDSALSSGYGLLKQLMDGSMKRLPDIRLGIVDVRDVADLHIKAMLNPNAKGERFLALSGGTMSLLEIAQLLKQEMPSYTQKTSVKPLPNWLLTLVAFFSDKAKAIKPLVGVYREASNDKARKKLGWKPRSNKEAILSSARCLVENGEV